MGRTTQKEAHLLGLFQTGKAPVHPDSGDAISPKVLIQKVWDENPILQIDYSKKNFYPLYRRKAAEFLTNQGKMALGVSVFVRVQLAVFLVTIFLSFCFAYDLRSSCFTALEKKAPPAASTEEEEDAADGDYNFSETVDGLEEEAEDDLKPASRPTATKTDEDVEDDNVEVSTADFIKMSITEASTTLCIPVLLYEYMDEYGHKYVTADVLMLSGCCKKDVEVKLSDDGRWVTVWVNIPETFLEPSRVDVQD
jgi:hypothetical protein